MYDDARIVGAESSVQRQAEAAMTGELGHAFLTIVRPVDMLRELVASDPYRPFRVAPDAKRVVTFLRDRPAAQIVLPVELEGARIHALGGREVFTSYVRGPKTPVFMTLIEKTFGKDATTRTWDTIEKIARRSDV